MKTITVAQKQKRRKGCVLLALVLVFSMLTACSSEGNDTVPSPSEQALNYDTNLQPPLEASSGQVLKYDGMQFSRQSNEKASIDGNLPIPSMMPGNDVNTEEYNKVSDNPFCEVTVNPLSTFSIDVDTASYSNIRRFLNAGQLPPKDSVRIEEMINYFKYDYPQPNGTNPFSVTTEYARCPWNPKHNLALIGIQGRKLENETLPPSNLVFLIDSSGSMEDQNKMPLLKSAFNLFVNNLRENDRVSIVTYAGSAGLVLDSTPGYEKEKILRAVYNLQAGGSTAGGAGIELAYKIAKENFVKSGNNRIILATDGDFNVGVSSDGELVKMIEEKRKDGIFLTILGFGSGNYKDGKMESLADKGNGNYSYIDSIAEANKVLVSEMGATLFAIAKDVKIQIEFNPSKIKAYRLIGYENRVLNKEDFNDDQKDAGELGAGHSVTALYEIVLAGSDEKFSDVDPLEYQQKDIKPSNDLMTVKLRYKEPSSTESKLLVGSLNEENIGMNGTGNIRFAAAVAEFGMLLRNSEYKADSSYDHVYQLALDFKEKGFDNYKAEFMTLVQMAQRLTGK